jgi:putative copper export protein
LLILAKTASWTAIAALAGAALGRYWLVPGRPKALPVVAAALAVPLLGVADLWLALSQVLPSFDAATLWSYASGTVHGHAVLWRSVAAAALAATLLLLPRRWWPLAAGLFVWLCFGFSRTSHAAAMGGTGPLVIDLAHLLGAAAWAGGVWRVTFPPPGTGLRAVERLSTLALVTVIVLALTGVFSALVHASEPARFLASGYAVALAVKAGVVALALVLAAANKFWALPRARRGEPGLNLTLRVECVVLLALLTVTGWLSTTPVPHGLVQGVDLLENARRVFDHLFR